MSRIIRRPREDTPFRYVFRRRKDIIRSWLARLWSDAQIVQAAQVHPLFESTTLKSKMRNARGFRILSHHRIRKLILQVRKDIRERVVDGEAEVKSCIETLDDSIQGARDQDDFKTVGYLIAMKTKLLGLHRISIDERQGKESNNAMSVDSIQKQLNLMSEATGSDGDD